jgi:hypothetical protein
MSFALALFTGCSNHPSRLEHPARFYEAWDVINQPSRLGRTFETRFENLPKSGQISKIPWSDYYWATQKAGLAFRWLNPTSSPFSYKLLSRLDALTLSDSELGKLSPAEKLDLFMGRYDFPTVISERKRSNPRAASWEGLCHGWAPAALEFEEPRPVKVESPQGLRIPFGSSDVKALLTWYMAFQNPLPAYGLGGRCDFSGPLGMGTAACRDANAGAFHIVLANMIGRFKEGFVMDIARAAEVWNQPTYAFKSREIGRQGPSPGAALGTKQEVIVESEVNYTIEIEPQWNALDEHRERQSVSSVVYRYRLELDAQGQIRGGDWLQDARPDFIWFQNHGTFSTASAAIQKIYEASRR